MLRLHHLEVYGSNPTFEIFEAGRWPLSDMFPAVPIRSLKWFPGKMIRLGALRRAAPWLESLSIKALSSGLEFGRAKLPSHLPNSRGKMVPVHSHSFL